MAVSPTPPSLEHRTDESIEVIRLHPTWASVFWRESSALALFFFNVITLHYGEVSLSTIFFFIYPLAKVFII